MVSLVMFDLMLDKTQEDYMSRIYRNRKEKKMIILGERPESTCLGKGQLTVLEEGNVDAPVTRYVLYQNLNRT